MNIKVKMPHFWRNIQWAGMTRELVLTFVGTTLSIVLTFGTAHYLEQKQLRKDGRQTAMMVIHDMENSAALVENYAKTEEERFRMTQYVLEHKDHLDDISTDTLSGVYFYLTQFIQGGIYKFDDSNEKLFLSNQDVWKNINNVTFIDVAQHFFYGRRVNFELFNHEDIFIHPIPYDEFMDYCNSNKSLNFSYVDYLSKIITRPTVTNYLKGFQSRMRNLTNCATFMRESAKHCKFLMDISDAELKAYLELRKHGGHPLKKSKLIGTWIQRDDLDRYDYTEYHADNTLTMVILNHVAHPYYVGRAEFKFVYTGTWEINGDSLITCINKIEEFSLDTTQIHIIPDKSEEMKSMIAEWYESLEQSKEKAEQDTTIYRRSWAAFMDGSGQQIGIWSTDEETGEESCSYMIKK